MNSMADDARRSAAVDGTHRVVACLGGDRTALEPRPLPRPGAGEMLLRLRVVGLCGTDLFKLDTGVAAGTVLGHELVGQVVALGERVTRFRIGDRVVVPHHVPCGECALCRRGNETMCAAFRDNLLEPGGFADNILVRPRATELAARRIPEHLADEAAVFMEPAACVLRGVARSEIGGVGGAAAVLGAGSMGLLHLLVLRAAFPDLAVVVVDPAPDRREKARELGAAAATEPGRPARDAVSAATGGLGADAVFDTVGGNATLKAGLEMTRPGGTVVLFAHAAEGTPAGFDLNTVFKSERRILGSYSAALAEQEQVFEMMCRGALDPTPLVSHTMPLGAFAEGVALARRQRALKVLFTPSRSSR